MLTFSTENSKIRKLAESQKMRYAHVVALDLPAGWTCPMAKFCLSKANPQTGKITDGPDCRFRCYAASTEAVFPTVRRMRWNNFNQLKAALHNHLTDFILDSIPSRVRIIRVHSSGDFFNELYFNAWLNVTMLRPNITFFAYTKVISYVNYPKPDNFRLTYSYGGKADDLLTNEPTCYVVKTHEEAEKLNVPLACENDPSDDFHFIMEGKSFALLLHGTQPAK